MNPLKMTEDDLHAYVDGALPAARWTEVESWLAGHPEDAERVAAYRAQKLALKALFDPVLDEPLPDHWPALAVQPLNATTIETKAGPTVEGKKRPKFKFPVLQRLAAAVLIAMLGGVGGWLAHARYPGGEPLARMVPLPQQAAVAHVVYSPDARRPVEVTADQEEALVKWLSKRLGTLVKPPKLGALGYELVGGRLLPGNVGPVAQFMYQDASSQRLTLYVSTENAGQPETGFRFARQGEINVFYWVEGKFGYALSAVVTKSELAKVATAVYDQLELK